MQSYNNEAELIAAGVYREAALEEARREAERDGAVSHVIGKFPNRGLVVLVNGIKYRVIASNAKKGKLTLVILKP